MGELSRRLETERNISFSVLALAFTLGLGAHSRKARLTENKHRTRSALGSSPCAWNRVTPFASILKHIIFVSEALKYPDSVTRKLQALKSKLFELPSNLGDDAKRLDESLRTMSRDAKGHAFSTAMPPSKALPAFDEVQASSLMKELMEIIGELETELSGTIDGPLRKKVIRVSTLDFHWVTRGQSNFGWFEDELKQLKKMDLAGRFNIHLHLTSAKGGNMEKAIVQ